MDRIDDRLNGIDTRLSNSSAYDPEDTIIPPKIGDVDPSAEECSELMVSESPSLQYR